MSTELVAEKASSPELPVATLKQRKRHGDHRAPVAETVDASDSESVMSQKVSRVASHVTHPRFHRVSALSDLYVGGRCLVHPSSDTRTPSSHEDAMPLDPRPCLDSLPGDVRANLQDSLEPVLDIAMKRLRKKGLIPHTVVSFTLTKESGLVFKFGERELQVAEYERFLQPKSPFNRMLTATSEARAYAECAGLGKRAVTVAKKTSEKRVAEAAAEAFKQIADERLAERTRLSKSFLQKHKEIFLLLTNISSALTNICSACPNNPLLVMASALFGVLKGANFEIYNITTLREIKFLNMLGIKKYELGDKLLIGNGMINAFLVILAGITLFVAGILLECSKKVGHGTIMLINKVIGTYLFGYVFGNIFALGWAILSIMRINNSIKLRKELNSFLENPNLSEKERYLGYLKKVREKITLTAEDKQKIREQVLSDFTQEIKQKDPGITDDELRTELAGKRAEIEHCIAVEENNLIKGKIEQFQKLSLKTTTERVIKDIDRLIIALEFGSEDDEGFARVLNEAKSLVREIDKATYQSLVSNSVYLFIFIVCLLGNLMLLVASPWGAAIWWTIVAIMFVFWDYSTSNINLTAKVYDFVRRKKAEEILGPEEHAEIIELPPPEIATAEDEGSSEEEDLAEVLSKAD